MERHSLIEGLRALDHKIVEQLDKIDATRRGLMVLIEDELPDREDLETLAHTLNEDLFNLRELYQQVIYKSTLLARAEGVDKNPLAGV